MLFIVLAYISKKRHRVPSDYKYSSTFVLNIFNEPSRTL